MSGSFDNRPGKTASIEPYRLNISDEAIHDFKALLKLSKIPLATWENSHEDRRYGVTAQWLSTAKEQWLNKFDW